MPTDRDFPLPQWRSPPLPSRAMLSGRTCILEPLNPEEHAAELYAAYAVDTTGAMWMYLPYGPFSSESEYRAWLEENCCGSDPLFFAIKDLQLNRVTGLAAYMRIKPKMGSLEVGHLSHSPALQKTTPATEAMYLMMKHAFELGYRRYEWKCNASNEKSRRAAERLGFSFEGIFRQAAVVKGRNRDTAWFSVLDVEWLQLEKGFQEWLHPNNFDENGRQIRRIADLIGKRGST